MSKWKCGKCGGELKPSMVLATYLGSEIREKQLKCEKCGLVLIPEEVATGLMLQAEQALEDK